MSDALTSDKLVESVKRRASVPESQATFTKADFLDFATEELRISLVPMLMSLHEDHLLFEEDVPLENGKTAYTIPSRAVGNKLRDLQLKHSENNYQEMTRIGIGNRFGEYDVTTSTNLRQYYVKNNKVVLTSTSSNIAANGDLTMVYYIKPSVMVQEDRVGIITGINRTTGVVTLNDVPDNFNISVKYDMYKATSPHSILKIDKTATNLNTTTNSITFAPSDIPEDLEIGDHISLAGEASIPQVPSDLHPMLAQMVACRVLESIGDSEGLQSAMVKLQQMQVAMGMIIDNRVDDSPRKIVNRHGLVRTSIFSKRFNRR